MRAFHVFNGRPADPDVEVIAPERKPNAGEAKHDVDPQKDREGPEEPEQARFAPPRGHQRDIDVMRRHVRSLGMMRFSGKSAEAVFSRYPFAILLKLNVPQSRACPLKRRAAALEGLIGQVKASEVCANERPEYRGGSPGELVLHPYPAARAAPAR